MELPARMAFGAEPINNLTLKASCSLTKRKRAAVAMMLLCTYHDLGTTWDCLDDGSPQSYTA